MELRSAAKKRIAIVSALFGFAVYRFGLMIAEGVLQDAVVLHERLTDTSNT